MATQQTITAVASMTSHGILGPDAEANRRILNAMVEAVRECQAAGITDPERLRAAQLEARDRVLAS